MFFLFYILLGVTLSISIPYIYISHVKGITKPLPPHFWCLDPFFCLPGDWPLTFINCGKKHLVQPRLEVREPCNSHKNHTKPPDFIVNIYVLLSWLWVPFSLHRPFLGVQHLAEGEMGPLLNLMETACGNSFWKLSEAKGVFSKNRWPWLERWNE